MHDHEFVALNHCHSLLNPRPHIRSRLCERGVKIARLQSAAEQHLGAWRLLDKGQRLRHL